MLKRLLENPQILLSALPSPMPTSAAASLHATPVALADSKMGMPMTAGGIPFMCYKARLQSGVGAAAPTSVVTRTQPKCR